MKTLFNPFQSLLTALGYSKSIWCKVNSLPLSDALPLIDLTFLLKEHIQMLVALCTWSNLFHTRDHSAISILSKFYQTTELSIPLSKRGSSLRKLLLEWSAHRACLLTCTFNGPQGLSIWQKVNIPYVEMYQVFCSMRQKIIWQKKGKVGN